METLLDNSLINETKKFQDLDSNSDYSGSDLKLRNGSKQPKSSFKDNDDELKSSNNSIIMTEELNDEDFNRPDVPEWFKDEWFPKDQNNNNNDNNKSENENVILDNKRKNSTSSSTIPSSSSEYKVQIVWRNVFALSFIHFFGCYGVYLSIYYGKIQTVIWFYFMALYAGLGILCGSHRLWTHRTYKAHWSLRLILMIGQTMAFQNDIYEWSRDHRVHHKFSDTDADPHNARRGFFFSHCGWLLCKKHPEVKRKGEMIDMSDIWNDPIVRFQRRFYIPLLIIFWGIIPVMVPVYFWNENIFLSINANFFRYVIGLHHTWFVNSWAHMYGYKFYDKNMEPKENIIVAYLTLGEGYHNYHHTFPWDYSSSEHGWRHNYNLTTMVIDAAAWLGLASERRKVSPKVIEQRVTRTGDTSIIPPYMDKKHRKPYYVILDFIIGFLASSWVTWVILISRLFIISRSN